MSKEVIDVRASDNEYFHLDFHLSMNLLIDFILMNHGYEGVIKYIAQYANAYHKPLKEKLQEGSLLPLKKYIEEIYQVEKTKVNINYSDDQLMFSIENCPGITHIKNNKQTPSIAYIETYRTLYQTLCKETPFSYHLLYFDEETGRSGHQFIRKETV